MIYSRNINPAKRLLNYTIALYVLLFTGFPVSAQLTIDDPAASQEYAMRLLKEMSDNLAELSQFTYHVDIVDEFLLYDGTITHLESSVDLMFKRPAGIMVDIKEDYNHKRFWYDGKKVTLFTIPAKFYAQFEAPATNDETLESLIDEKDITIPTSDILYSEPYKVLTESVKSGYYAGLHLVGGKSFHHLVFKQDNIDWQIWLENNPRRLPRKLLIKYKTEEGQPSHVVRFSDWNLSPSLTNNMFQFLAPPGTAEIEFADFSK